ncbi:MAG: PKD domain-containing protein [Thermoplasmatota archaeon]
MVRRADGRIENARVMHIYFLSGLLLFLSFWGSLFAVPITGNDTDEAGDPPVADAGDDITGHLLNDVVMLNGSGSSDEEIELCTWEWESTTHPEIVASPENSSTPTFTVTVEETITFQLTLTDPAGQFSIDTVDVIVEANEPPRITIASPSPTGSEGPFYERSRPIEFSANGTSDPEGRDEELTYLWTSNVSGQLSTQRFFTTVIPDLGWHRITLKVDDLNGGSSEEVLDIRIREDPFSPEASIFIRPTRSDLRYGKSELITFDASSTKDANSFDTIDTLNFTWMTDLPADTILGYGPIVQAALIEGVHNITLEVEDTDGLTDRDWIIIESFNSPPEADIRAVDIRLRASVPTLNESEAGEFSASRSSDPDGDELDYGWDFGDGDTAAGEVVTHSWDEFGRYNITLFVDDSSDMNSSGEIGFTISINSIPVAMADQGISVEVGETFSITANGSYDRDNDTLSYRWDFDGDGLFDSSRFDPSWKFNVEGEYEVLVQVSDGFAFSEAVSTVEVVYPNEAPRAALANEMVDGEIIVKLSDDRGEVELDATPSIDPDDDTDGNGEINDREEDNLTYSWDLDPEEDSDDDGIEDNDVDDTGRKVTVKLTQSGLTTVILNVSDPRGLSDSMEIKLRGNHPPDTLSIRVGPSTKVLAGAQVTFTGSADDDDRADRNRLEYYWDFGDGESTSTSNFQSRHTYYDEGTYEVELRVSDGILESTTRTSISVVEMEAPSISYPSEGSEVSGLVTITGRVREVRGFEVDKVEIREGENDWGPAEGTTQWSYDLDTTKHPNGDLALTIRYTVNDAEDIQSEITITVNVANNPEGGVDWFLLIAGGAILLVIFVVLFILFRRKPRNWDDLLPPPTGMPAMPPVVPPGGLPPAKAGPSLPAAQPPKETDAPKQAEPPKEEKAAPRTIRIKCPACSKVFKVTDTGERPLHMTCKHCGATGSIDHVPGEEEHGEKEADAEKEDQDEEAPVEPVPIVCPSCQNLFELEEVAETAKCPICGVEGDLDDDTVELLKERFGGTDEEYTLRCPSCSGTFKVKSGDPSIICPFCGAKGRASA